MIFADLVSFEKVFPLAVFGLFAVVTWWLLSKVAGGRTRAVERLDEFRDPMSRKREEAKKKKKQDGGVSKMLERAPAFARPLQPKTEQEAGRLKSKLSMAGFRGESAVPIFLGLKFIGLIVGLIMVGGPSLFVMGLTQKTLMYTVLGGGGMFYLPDVVVWFITRSRKDQIFMSLPDALDLLVVCVEAGLGLDQAMRKVSEELKRTARVICDEFALCNFQLQMGRARSDVLHELGARTGVDDLRALAAILIQADKFGSSIAQALRVQSDSMRTRRRQLAEEKAAKTAVKLIFPLVIFIFPGIFVVLVGPAAITMVRELFPSMGAK